MVADRASCSAPAFLGLPDRNGGFGTPRPIPSRRRGLRRQGSQPRALDRRGPQRPHRRRGRIRGSCFLCWRTPRVVAGRSGQSSSRALSLRAASLLVAIDRDDPILGTAARAPEAAPAPGPHVRATRRPEPSRLRRVQACAPPRLVRRALKSLPPTARDRLAVEERLACYEAANRLHNPRKPVSESAPRRLHTLTTAA